MSGDPDVECKDKANNTCTPISINSDHNKEVQIIPKIEILADIKALCTMQMVQADPSKAWHSTSNLLKTISNNFNMNAQLTCEYDHS